MLNALAAKLLGYALGFFAAFSFGKIHEKKKHAEQELKDARADLVISSKPRKRGRSLLDRLQDD